MVKVASIDKRKEQTELELLQGAKLGNREIAKELGQVQGSATWRKPVLHDYLSGIRLLLGTPPKEDEALEKARQEAKARMCEEATKLGACAVLDHHFMFVRLGLMNVEIRCFGRAVTFS